MSSAPLAAMSKAASPSTSPAPRSPKDASRSRAGTKSRTWARKASSKPSLSSTPRVASRSAARLRRSFRSSPRLASSRRARRSSLEPRYPWSAVNSSGFRGRLGRNAGPAGRNARRSLRRDDKAADNSRNARDSFRSRGRAARRHASSSPFRVTLGRARSLSRGKTLDGVGSTAGSGGVIAAYSASHPTGAGDEGRGEGGSGGRRAAVSALDGS